MLFGNPSADRLRHGVAMCELLIAPAQAERVRRVRLQPFEVIATSVEAVSQY